MPLDGLPADLRAVFAHVRRRRAEYVLFDCDALPDQDLPILHPGFATPYLANQGRSAPG